MNNKTSMRENNKQAAYQGRAEYHHIMKSYGEDFLADLPKKMDECIKATSNLPDVLFLPEQDLPRRMICILGFIDEAIKCGGVCQEDFKNSIQAATHLCDYPFLSQDAFS